MTIHAKHDDWYCECGGRLDDSEHEALAAAMTPLREPRTTEDAMVALLDLLPGSLGTDRAINRALDAVVSAARAEAAGAPLHEAHTHDLRIGASEYGSPDWQTVTAWQVYCTICDEAGRLAVPAATPAPAPLDVEALRLPWHRETVGHLSTAGIVASVAADLNVPLDEGLPPNTDATWIVNADNKVVAFVGNGRRQTHTADAIIAAVTARAAATEDSDAADA